MDLEKRIWNLIRAGILAKPKKDNIPLKLQTIILRSKGFEGSIIYETYAGKILSVFEDGEVRVSSPSGQILEKIIIAEEVI